MCCNYGTDWGVCLYRRGLRVVSSYMIGNARASEAELAKVESALLFYVCTEVKHLKQKHLCVATTAVGTIPTPTHTAKSAMLPSQERHKSITRTSMRHHSTRPSMRRLSSVGNSLKSTNLLCPKSWHTPAPIAATRCVRGHLSARNAAKH